MNRSNVAPNISNGNYPEASPNRQPKERENAHSQRTVTQGSTFRGQPTVDVQNSIVNEP